MKTTLRRQPAFDLPAGAGDGTADVHARLRTAILSGAVPAGARLPSSRDLSERFGVGRTAVVLAFERLAGDGLLEMRHGSGTFVAAAVPAPRVSEQAAAPTIAAPPRRPFALGCTESDPHLLGRLGAATRRRIASAGPADLAYGDPRGSADLRREIARALLATRGIVTDPARIVLVGGVQAGLRLCAEALLSPGDAVLFEDPGYVAARRTLEAAGMALVPVPVDREGMDIAAAGGDAATAARAAYVTPSNGFPSGVSMSLKRRAALLEWARRNDAWILEDDYDNEFRYEGAPLTALAGLDGGDRVIYLGTFSKTLFPALRIAFLVLPGAALETVIARRAVIDRAPPHLIEGAVADLMADGTVAAHTRRMRKRYRAARDLLAGTLADAGGERVRIVVPAQGLHILAVLPPEVSTASAAAIRAEANVEAPLLGEMRLRPGGPEAYVLGFSGFADDAIRNAAIALGRAIRRAIG